MGNEKLPEKELAHKNINKRPSDDLNVCGKCHTDIANSYTKSLHYTVQGFQHSISRRLSKNEDMVFKKKVFGTSCKSCHATCGDCHVLSPSVEGISAGLIEGHRFVKKDEGKTCAFCHGGRVYPEFTGEYGGGVDVHYQKGMTCMDCHKKAGLHGDGNMYLTKNEAKGRPKCKDCHKTGGETKATVKLAHTKHDGKVSCYGCHSQGEYRNCYSCHLEKGSTSKPGFILGKDPGDEKTLTTLRIIPIVRDTFTKAGIKMELFDTVTDYKATPVHNIRKRTDRTRSCDVCHVEKKHFLTKELLMKDGSKANEGLIFNMKPLKIN
ncbi:MAG: cytochrome c3 family protein [Proteobacteria bacterium]|nr:cytochrome c3 family protein [Pseudomonadota bacterium]